MQISYPAFDQLVTEHFTDVYRLCFLLTGEPAGAWQTTFQTFLYMGTQKEEFTDPDAEQDALYRWCVHTCTDYYYRKIRKRPRRARFQENVPFSVSDGLWTLLGMPFKKRASVFFTCYLGYTQEHTRHILNKKAGHQPAPHRAAGSSSSDVSEDQWREAISSVSPAEDGEAQMLSEIYLRFEERNVPLENKLRDIRSWWDHSVIWIAAAILLLFAAAAWYTARIIV